MPRVEVHISLAEEFQEFFVAIFQDDFEGFRFEGDQLWAYATVECWNEELQRALEGWLKGKDGASILDSNKIAEKNWNAEWEKSIKPISAGGFIVLPSWSLAEFGDHRPIIIDPKMSFGTGHHETTRLMLLMMDSENFSEQFILDAGTGTGVLAIAAMKLGSQKVVAFDIDDWSIANGAENRKANEVRKELIDFRHGFFHEAIKEEIFDGILANINRNALFEMLPQFYRHLRNGGFMLISGLLDSDQDHFCDKAKELGFHLEQRVSENEWIGLRFKKGGT